MNTKLTAVMLDVRAVRYRLLGELGDRRAELSNLYDRLADGKRIRADDRSLLKLVAHLAIVSSELHTSDMAAAVRKITQ